MELRHIRYFLGGRAEDGGARARRAASTWPAAPQPADQGPGKRGRRGAVSSPGPRRKKLTEAGKAFLAGVKEMPLIAERAAMAARRASGGEPGSLRIGFTPSTTFDGAGGAVRNPLPPDAPIQRSISPSRRPMGRGLWSVCRRARSMAAFLRPGASAAEGLQLKQLAEEPMVVALPKAHRAAGWAAKSRSRDA